MGYLIELGFGLAESSGRVNQCVNDRVTWGVGGTIASPKNCFMYLKKLFINMFYVIVPPTKEIVPCFLMSVIG